MIIVVQLLYPSERALPLARLRSEGYIGFAAKNDVMKKFEDFDSRIVTVHTHSKVLTTTYKDIGVNILPAETVDTMTAYSFRERLVPFSMFTKSATSYPVKRDIDQSRIELYVNDVIDLAGKRPVDATVSLKGTKFNITPAEEGYEYEVSSFKSQILRSDLEDGGQIVFAPTVLKPGISTDAASSAVAWMQQRINNPLTVNAEKSSLTLTSELMASWVDILPREKQDKIDIVFNRKKVSKSLAKISSMVDYPATSTVVTYLNGVEVGRKLGEHGKRVYFDKLVDGIVGINSPVTSAYQAQVETLLPAVVVDRKYSKDSLGVQNLIEFWAQNNTGQYSIEVRSLNGQITASLSPHKLLPSIGVYRMYIASLVYGKIAAGNVGPLTQTETGQNVQTCLVKMLRESEQTCTDALGAMVGWGASDTLLKAQGFESTTLTEGASLTTANDLSDWLQKLSEGSISRLDHRDELFDSMSDQTLDIGLNAGSDSRVASEYGQYGRYINNAGVVYHPTGAYTVSIMSEGASPESLKLLSKEIYKVMSQ